MALRNLAAIQWLPGSEAAVQSRSSRIGPISLGAKQTGERSAGNPHAAFDVAGTGDVAWSRWCDTRKRKGETTENKNFDLHRLLPQCNLAVRSAPMSRLARASGQIASHPMSEVLQRILQLELRLVSK